MHLAPVGVLVEVLVVVVAEQQPMLVGTAVAVEPFAVVVVVVAAAAVVVVDALSVFAKYDDGVSLQKRKSQPASP